MYVPTAVTRVGEKLAAGNRARKAAEAKAAGGGVLNSVAVNAAAHWSAAPPMAVMMSGPRLDGLMASTRAMWSGACPSLSA